MRRGGGTGSGGGPPVFARQHAAKKRRPLFGQKLAVSKSSLKEGAAPSFSIISQPKPASETAFFSAAIPNKKKMSSKRPAAPAAVKPTKPNKKQDALQVLHEGDTRSDGRFRCPQHCL
jgi:hypothetical protein